MRSIPVFKCTLRSRMLKTGRLRLAEDVLDVVAQRLAFFLQALESPDRAAQASHGGAPALVSSLAVSARAMV